MLPNEVAASVHSRMCWDERFGYDWGSRWGRYEENWTVGGRDISIKVGDYDCSSSVITAWNCAFQGTPYHIDATYTGNMMDAFLATGLFEVWDTDSTVAELGDVYLNHQNHTAMCQWDGDNEDCLSEFSINEFGECYGGREGDQSDWESHIAGFYNYPWNCTLHYIGGDIYGGDPVQEDNAQDVWHPSASSQWQGAVIGFKDSTGAGDDYAGVYGSKIVYLAIEGVGDYQVHTLGQAEHHWLPTVDHYNLDDEEYGMAGEGSPIDGLRIFDNTVYYQVHTTDGTWHEPMHGTSDSSGCDDDYAGVYGLAIDAIRVWREKGEQPCYNVRS